jgi:beta-glucanase (GH16 family)
MTTKPCSTRRFKLLLTIVATIMIPGSMTVFTDGIAHAATGDRLDRSRLTLTFEDDFTAPLSLWNPRSGEGRWKTCYWFGWQPTGRGCVDKSSRTIDTDGSQYVLVDAAYNNVNPFRQSNGQLAIEVAKNARPDDPKTAGRAYTAGMLTSEPSFAQRYGYFEIKMRLPAGKGYWPAFWMLPADHAVPFEIDIMENHGKDPGTIYCTAHWGDGTYTLFPVQLDSVQNEHTYGVLWSREELVWYVDDVEVARTANRDLHSPMYVIAGMGVGGNWGGNPDANTKFPAEMLVDYVKVYRIDR